MKQLQLTILLLTLVLACFTLNAQNTDKEYSTAVDSIVYGSFLEHLKYLSSDELEGRGIGTDGYAKAADYVAKELEKNGLVPFGDSGTYFQEVLLSKPSVMENTFKFQINKGPEILKAGYGSEVSVILSTKNRKVNEKLQMVFAGYGNVVPGEKIDDYKGLNVSGKIVIVALGGPKGIENPAFDDRQAKFDNAIANDAAGILLYYPKADLFQNLIVKKVHGYLSEKMLFLVDSSNNINVPRLPVFAKKQFIADIMRLNGLSLKKELRDMNRGNTVGKELITKLNCSFDLKRDTIKSKNVVALLPGSTSSFRKEYLVVGAHLDGLGIGKAVKGDSIYNGMLDNASGASAILSISKAFGRMTGKPKKSIVFVCYTAEETGLLGSSYYVNNNQINDGTITANINIDMLARTFDTNEMAPLGYSHSNLAEAADFAATVLDIKIDDNQEAEKAYMERSDQISFIKKGIPSLFISSGLTALDNRKNGKRAFDKWMKQIYHSPFDEANQDFSDREFLKAIRFNFLTAYYITYRMEKITWNENGWLYREYVQDIE